MKPVLILQHLHNDGPAYLATWLQQHGIAFDLRNAEAGDTFPASLDGHAALAVLGGEISANDELASLRQAEGLIREALARGVPAIGHCLGGQLMARALGAGISASTAPEIGWRPMLVHDDPVAREWFGRSGDHTVFHWHYEAFDLPAGAQPLATSAACDHQAFVLGSLLAMQFHVEVDAEKLDRWSRIEDAEYVAAQRQHGSTVQTGEAMRRSGDALLASQQALAARIYGRWWQRAIPR